MADMTKAQIADEALERMGVKPVGQDAETNDSNDLQAAYDELYAELEADNLVAWGATESVPERYVSTIAHLIAWSRISKYLPPPEVVNTIVADVGVDGEKGKNKLRRLIKPKHVDKITPGNYF